MAVARGVARKRERTVEVSFRMMSYGRTAQFYTDKYCLPSGAYPTAPIGHTLFLLYF